MIDMNELTLFLYILARVSGFILFNPILSRSNIPNIVKSGIIMVLSVFTISLTTQTVPVPSGIVEFSIRALMEMMLGFLLGMVVNIFFYIPQLAGHMIDAQMGMTMNQVYDAGSHSNQSVTSIFFNIMMTLLFFAANGHHTLFRIMLTSGDIVPFGAVSVNMKLMANAMVELFAECTVLAVKLCLPVLAAELLGQLGMGILMKVIPQINVFSINIELKVVIGLVMVFMMIAPFSEFLLQTEVIMLKRLEEILKLAGT